MEWDKKERQALEYAARGLKPQAIALLYELIVHYALALDFKKAVSLRKTLIQTDSMALTEIIKSGEIIDEQKSKAIDVNHKNMWKGLYDSFSEEETNEFYFALKTIQLPPGKTIVQQGKVNDKLFLVHKGSLKEICLSGTKEFFLKEFGPGEILGSETFFSISLATTTIITTRPVQLSYLTLKALSELKEILPGFDMKLQDLCAKLIRFNASEMVKQQKIERRKYQRFPVDGKVAVFFLDANGKPKDPPLYGVLDDLSQGGASFIVRSSTKENARALLGQMAVIKWVSKKDPVNLKETKTGRILALGDQLFSEYSISFKFSKPLSNEVLRRFTD